MDEKTAAQSFRYKRWTGQWQFHSVKPNIIYLECECYEGCTNTWKGSVDLLHTDVIQLLLFVLDIILDNIIIILLLDIIIIILLLLDILFRTVYLSHITLRSFCHHKLYQFLFFFKLNVFLCLFKNVSFCLSFANDWWHKYKIGVRIDFLL